MHRIILLILGASFLHSCTTESWYQGSKASHDASCLQLPDAEYEDCKKENDIDYETYNRKRNEINKSQ